MYLGKYKGSVFFSPTLLYVYVYMAPQFSKISFIVIAFDRFLCQRKFLQGLKWILMSFSTCSVRFLVRPGGILLWFLRKINTPTFVRTQQ